MSHFISSIFISVFFCLGFCNCSYVKKSEYREVLVSDNDTLLSIVPPCPKGHVDSIIPIRYGFPDEWSFALADSGLIHLGGCEMSHEIWYCKIHTISF